MKIYKNLFYEPCEIMEKLPSGYQSEMSFQQLAFLMGLIKEHKPKKLVEIGVAEGGTTAVILHCISMLDLETKVISIDLLEDLWSDKSKKSGYQAEEYMSLQEKTFDYTLYTGKYAVECLRTIGGDIDFLILDTVHRVPGEILDFLACYPFLKKDAVVVLHDIALNHWNNNQDAIATKVLLDTVTAEKFIGIDEENENLLNIGAFMITDDTSRYIDDIFSALTITWRYRPEEKELELYRKFYCQYYSDEKIELFDMAVRMNQNTLNQKVPKKSCMQKDTFLEIYEWIEKIKYKGKGIYVYGYGYYGKRLYNMLDKCGVHLKGYIISDGQDKGENKNEVFYLSEINKDVDKSSNTILVGVDVPLQAEICAALSSVGIHDYVLPCHSILLMLA